MKPFDLELAKQGHPVVTRIGEPVRIICTDAKREDPIISLVFNGAEESIRAHRNDGRYIGIEDSNFDIFMAPEKKKAWVNIYQGVNQSMSHHFTHFSEDAACLARYHGTEGNGHGPHLSTVTYEWEE